MITANEAIKIHEKKFEERREEFDKIINEEIKNNFDISSGTVTVKNDTVAKMYNMFENVIDEYCKKSGRKISKQGETIKLIKRNNINYKEDKMTFDEFKYKYEQENGVAEERRKKDEDADTYYAFERMRRFGY